MYRCTPTHIDTHLCNRLYPDVSDHVTSLHKAALMDFLMCLLYREYQQTFIKLISGLCRCVVLPLKANTGLTHGLTVSTSKTLL